MGGFNRRDFFKFVTMPMTLALLPIPGVDRLLKGWPFVKVKQLPEYVQQVMAHVPNLRIDRAGYMTIIRDGDQAQRIPLAQTDWNKENTRLRDQLVPSVSWAIVLHWYGDHELYDKTVRGYLRGFNQGRVLNGRNTKSSAHYLVGSGTPVDEESDILPIGVLQLQEVSPEGLPYQAGSLHRGTVFNGLKKRSYFLRAAEELKYQDPAYHSFLIDLKNGSQIDPNLRSIAIEITGKNFDDVDHHPSQQKIANVLSTVLAIMRRYKISAANILGHNELQSDKSDPGKKFMALIRFLVGIHALLENDPWMKELVFGQYLQESTTKTGAVVKYFKYVYEYLKLTGTPRTVYEWEKWSQYWHFMERLQGGGDCQYAVSHMIAPIGGDLREIGDRFLDPLPHEGIDLYPVDTGDVPVRMVGDGRCLYVGRSADPPVGTNLIFRHRLPSAAEVISIYGNMDHLQTLRVGEIYPQGTRIGSLDGDDRWSHLHFAIGYGNTWDTLLRENRKVPGLADSQWIEEYFLNPEAVFPDLDTAHPYHRSTLPSPDSRRDELSTGPFLK